MISEEFCDAASSSANTLPVSSTGAAVLSVETQILLTVIFMPLVRGEFSFNNEII